jgi:hypothetical protein
VNDVAEMLGVAPPLELLGVLVLLLDELELPQPASTAPTASTTTTLLKRNFTIALPLSSGCKIKLVGTPDPRIKTFQTRSPLSTRFNRSAMSGPLSPHCADGLHARRVPPERPAAAWRQAAAVQARSRRTRRP